MEYEKKKEFFEDGKEVRITEYIAALPITDGAKKTLCSCFAIITNLGYETGFKAALSLCTGYSLNDPEITKFVNEFGKAASINTALFAEGFYERVSECCKNEEGTNV